VPVVTGTGEVALRRGAEPTAAVAAAAAAATSIGFATVERRKPDGFGGGVTLCRLLPRDGLEPPSLRLVEGA